MNGPEERAGEGDIRIGIDGAYALAGDGAAERYSRRVIEGVAGDYPGYKMMVYVAKMTHKRRLPLIDDLHNVEYRLPAPSGFTGRLWLLFGITNCLQPDKIDVYHGVAGELPLNIAAAHVATVVSLPSDRFSAFNASGFFDIVKRFRLYVLRESLRNATLVLVSSESEKRCLVELTGLPEDKIEVLTDEAFTPEALTAIYRKAIARHRD